MIEISRKITERCFSSIIYFNHEKRYRYFSYLTNFGILFSLSTAKILQLVIGLNFKFSIKYIKNILQFFCFCFQSFNEYFSNEHGRLLSLWREVVAFRRSFGELKTATERDMSHLRSDVTKTSRSMHSACLNLSANQRSSDTQLSNYQL